MRRLARIIIAGTHSGVGKTTVATGLMSALSRRGLVVQGFKVGPDYIDPSYHAVATGRPARNIDLFLVPPAAAVKLFLRASAGADIAVIEGVMGLFDGYVDGGASSAAVAKLLQVPVLLVVDASSIGQSAAALVYGYSHYDPEVKVAGVILNRIAGERHLALVKDAVEQGAGVPVVGWLARQESLTVPSRHLGLVPAGERRELAEKVGSCGAAVASGLDLERILALAQAAPPLEEPQGSVFPAAEAKEKVAIAVARDAAFSFYYQDSLDFLAALGAELIPFSPLADEDLPAGARGLIIGGGFPEVFLPELAANRRLITAIRSAAARGLPIYAECGGLMYLCRAIYDREGRAWPMVGLVPVACRMEERLVGMGYRQGQAIRSSLLFASGEQVKGHEFHYSRLVEAASDFPWAYQLQDGRGRCRPEGYARGNLLASYLHLHFAGLPAAARRFLAACREYSPRPVS